MKIILSRKGVDSAAGGLASPILPDGRLLSFPIPSTADAFTLDDLNIADIDAKRLATDLSGRGYGPNRTIHLDPDLSRAPARRLPGWCPALGQTGAAQTHLQRHRVGTGDVFLLFGWFREVECRGQTWRYRQNAPDLHVIFGWLEIGKVLNVAKDRAGVLDSYPGLADHPHVANPDAYTDGNNSLYVARAQSAFRADAEFGAGRFERLSAQRTLTAPGMSRSRWQLPGWFQPKERPALSYHQAEHRWQTAGNNVLLATVGRGQEFVLDGEHYPELADWLASIIRDNN